MGEPTLDGSQSVILVHGTFATSKEDRGAAWWQVGSATWRALQAKLPRRVRLPEEGRVFRWSGENSERARSKAAAELLEFVKPLEQAGKDYHLIGHSHGGSVIWSALRLASLRRQRLDHLLSWSTVGTPFLHQKSRSPWSIINLAYMFFAAVLLFPAAKVFCFLARLPYNLAVGNFSHGLIIPREDDINPITALIRSPVIKLLEFFGVPFKAVDEGIRVGSFDPESGHSPALFLFGSTEGWLILTAVLLFAYVNLLLCSYCVIPVAEVLRTTWEKRLEQQAFRRYGHRWLGIWTKDDEAINGLQKTLEFSVSFVANLAPRERIFVSDLVGVPSRPLLWLVAPSFNRLVKPVLDARIRDLVVKTAQGNNRPAVEVVAVSPHPILAPETLPASPLPDWLAEKILERADLHAKEIGPKLRILLGEPSLNAGLERFGQALAGQELVHTSYFDHPEVLELLAMNISQTQAKGRPRRVCSNKSLVEWFVRFREEQAQHCAVNDVMELTQSEEQTSYRRAA